MPNIIEQPLQLHENPSYDVIYEQIIAGLKKQLPGEILLQISEYERSSSAPNRLRIYLDRNRFPGTHYEICFHRSYYEFALHFESTPAKDLERRKAFDSLLEELTEQVGPFIKSGKLENKGRMRVWYEQKRELVGEKQISSYIDQYSRFMTATFPILNKVYSI